MAAHPFRATVRWSGNRGSGTSSYTAYSRDHEIAGDGKSTVIPGTSDLAPGGDRSRYTPEELVAAALASCHMLWFLHLAAVEGVVVTSYGDAPEGILEIDREHGGRIVGVTLRPRVGIGRGDPSVLPKLHAAAHEKCFVANSVNFPVRVEPAVVPAPTA